MPAWGKELDDSILPAEAGLDETHVSFTKGCYPGQEPVARLRHRGKANRRLRVLEVEAAAPGDEIRYEREGRRPGDALPCPGSLSATSAPRFPATRSSRSAPAPRGYTDRPRRP